MAFLKMRGKIALALPENQTRKIFFVASLVFFASVLFFTGIAFPSRQPVRIGALTVAWGPTPSVVGLRDGLLELGYGENEDFVIGVRFTQGNITALPAVARELVQYGVDIIFATDEESAKAAHSASSRIPVVFAVAQEPIGAGLIKSFARPGGNITGITQPSLVSKQLELLKQVVPDLKRVLFPYDANHATSIAAAKTSRDFATRLGLELVERPLQNKDETRTALLKLRKGEVDGILLPPSDPFLNIPGLTLETSSTVGIPAMFSRSFWVDRGGLCSYGPDTFAAGRQAARLVDKILKGTSPSDIPVEVSRNIIFVINLKAAKALGLRIAPEVLYRADRLVR